MRRKALIFLLNLNLQSQGAAEVCQDPPINSGHESVVLWNTSYCVSVWIPRVGTDALDKNVNVNTQMKLKV